MKLIKITSAVLFAAIGLFGSSACTRDIPHVATPDSSLAQSATVQVFDATVKSVRNYVYVDGKTVSGAAVAFGGVFPGTAFSFRVGAGSRSLLIKDTLSTSTQVPINFTQSFDAGKSYTVFTYDTTVSAKQITVQNTITIPKDTSSMLRFANFVYNATAVPNVDVYSYRKGTGSPVFSNIASTLVSDFIPYASGITDTLYVYAAGTTTPLLNKSFVTSLTPTRSYTAIFAGSFRGTKAITTFVTY
jgi:hypothetical protein